jgi:hypothetical protein
MSGAVLLAIALAGCAQKTDQTSMDQTTDSLLASNPVETPEGSLAPQTDYTTPQVEPPQQQPAATRPRTPNPSPAPSRSTDDTREPADHGVTLAAGTPIEVSVAAQISSETANQGDTWTGEVKQAVIVGDRVVVPAGATATGVITGVNPAQKGERAFLVLEVRSIDANGKTIQVEAPTDSIIAGSTRARNLGAIAGGAAAGALIGKAVGGGKGALIGGLVGGAAATGAVAKSKGYQVVLKEGTALTFNVSHNVKIRS